MRQFRDSVGRLWEIAIHVAAVKRVRSALGVDLAGLIADGAKPLAQLLGDPCQFVDVLFVLCRQQAAAAGVSDEEFGAALGGDVLASAADAFMEELIDFFPDPRARDQLRRMIEAGKAIQSRLIEEAGKALSEIDPPSVARKWIASSGDSPASSASTLDPSPSAN